MDPKIALSSLLEEESVTPKQPAPFTSEEFPFQKADRYEATAKILNKVVLNNWLAFCKTCYLDKKAWNVPFVYGMSGIGKTRFCLKLLELLQQQIEIMGSKKEEVKELLDDLRTKSEVILLDLRHNGSEISPEEATWPASSILGL